LKILKQEKNGNKVKVEVEVEHKQLNSHIDKVSAEAASDLVVSGFRKGKVPKNIAEQYLNRDVIKEHAIQDMVADLYPKIIAEAKIEPIDYPNVVILNQKENEPFTFSLEVEVYPAVKLGKYKGLKVESETTKVTEVEVDEFVEQLRQSVANFIEVEGRGAGHGDLVELDVKASSEKGLLPALSSRAARIELGLGQISKDFDREIIGLTVGLEKKFSIKMPEAHPIKDLAGASVDFIVMPKKIMKKELPDVNDEFAKQFANLPTLEVLRDDIRERVSENKRSRIESDTKNNLLEQVSKNITADIPEGMIRRETDLMIDDLKASLVRDRMTFEQYLKLTKKSEKDVRGELRPGAEARVRSKLALKAIADVEKIEVSGEDMGLELKSLAQSSGEPAEKFEGRVGESGLEYIKDYLVRRKALEFLVSSAKVVERKK
jgi:trigger factor